MRYSLLVASMLMPALLSAQGASGNSNARASAKATKHVVMSPDNITWKQGPPSLPPGTEMAVIDGDPSKAGLFAMRLRMPDGYRIPPHFHGAAEHVTVIKGTFILSQGSVWRDGEGTELPAGGFAVMPPGMRHYVLTRGETEVQVHAMGPWKLTYVNKADDPRTAKKP